MLEEELKNRIWQRYFKKYDCAGIVPQDVRERKGAFYTPQIWVELSQKYLANTFGVNWQEEYYIWDCCAGTGNLLNGLSNKYKIFASTLDQQDVDVMRDRIRNGANLLENHVFQFDFLNDDFFSEKVPEKLREIIADEKLRQKLIIYINPPYSEPSSYGKGGKPQVANLTKTFKRFSSTIGSEAMQELYAQFYIRICNDLPGATLSTFSTPKFITSQKFDRFRQNFKAKFLKGFACKAETFDNVDGKFPIGFYILSLNNTSVLKKIALDVYDNDKALTKYTKIGKKTFSSVIGKSIGEWRKTFYDIDSEPIGYAIIVGPSMQSNNNTFFTSAPALSYQKKGMVANITANNVVEFSIYLAVRQCVEANWINDKDNYLYPSNKWAKDKEFHTNCLIYTLFHSQNRISGNNNINHWIPFTEYEVDAKEEFASHFMSNFLAGKIKSDNPKTLFVSSEQHRNTEIVVTHTAQAVLNAGRELWRYYHTMVDANPNASLYDIKEYFQGRDKNGKMNASSSDQVYTKLMGSLKSALWDLGELIKPKVYEYGFLDE